MRIDIITLFPRFFEPILFESIIGRAQAKGLARIVIHDLRAFVRPGERADDAPYGGGPGMVLRLPPLVACLETLVGGALQTPAGTRIVVTSPCGRQFDHAAAVRLSRLERLIIVCGHYEGIDERLFDLVDAEALSLGAFVLTGGEIPALAFADACIRLLPGVISGESVAADSFAAGSLDWPHFTRPAVFRGISVPDTLLSGDHAAVERWRNERARERTVERRRQALQASSEAGPPARKAGVEVEGLPRRPG